MKALLSLVVVLLSCFAAPAYAGSYVHVNDAATKSVQTFTDKTAQITYTASKKQIMLTAKPKSGGPGWWIWIEAPEDSVLQPGWYPTVTCAPVPAGRAMGLHVSRGEQLCELTDPIYGWVSLRQLQFKPDGKLSKLELAFSQRLGSDKAAPTQGLVLFNTAPMYAKLQAHRASPFSYIDISGHGATSILRGHGRKDDFVYVFLSLPKQNWGIGLVPPRGKALRPGRFRVTQNYSAVDHQLILSRNFYPLRCPGDQVWWSGWANVKAIGKNPKPKNEWYYYSGMWIEFEVACPGQNNKPIRGVVRVGV